MGEKGLAGQVRKAPIEKVFELSTVKRVCRYADGYQPHLVSPEAGVRALGSEAMDLLMEPVASCVRSVHQLLVNAGRDAAEKAGHYTESALVGSLPMYVPDFKNTVFPAIVAALDEWKADADRSTCVSTLHTALPLIASHLHMCLDARQPLHRRAHNCTDWHACMPACLWQPTVALMLVDMERSYITAGFFRHTMHNRYEKLRMMEEMQARNAAAAAKGTTGGGGSSGGGGGAKSYFPAFGASKDGDASGPSAGPDDDSGDERPGGAATGGGGRACVLTRSHALPSVHAEHG
eukprot:364722-Chlamydomonas_euryale.AAC.8